MSDSEKKRRSAELSEVEWEIRRRAKFTPEAALGQMAGPGAMKGQSPVPRLQQAEFEIAAWLNGHVKDAGGTLAGVLHRDVTGNPLLLSDMDHPLAVLAAHCRQVLGSEYLLKELVRNADVEWGSTMGERPYFETEGAPRDPNDPYTIESVRNILSELIVQLAAEK